MITDRPHTYMHTHKDILVHPSYKERWDEELG